MTADKLQTDRRELRRPVDARYWKLAEVRGVFDEIHARRMRQVGK